MRNGMYGILPLVSMVSLCAQAPAPQETPQQRAITESREIERLMVELKPREALFRAEALLPVTPEPFDKKDLRGALESFQRNTALAKAYALAGKAAFASGYWDKAVDYNTKARDLAKQSYEDTKETLVPAAANLRAAVIANKKAEEESASYIDELKAKPNPDAGDKQQIEIFDGLKTTIISNEKWAKICDENVEFSKKTMEYYATAPDEATKYIAAETEQLAAYRFPNNKVKYVEGIISSAKFMAQFQDKQSKVEYLYRLNVLDPDNKKVLKAIETTQTGKMEAQPKPARKKNG